MQFKPLIALAIATSMAQAAAPPYHLFKRYENVTAPVSSSEELASSSAEGDHGYSASILPTDQSVAESPSSTDEDEWITSTIIEYVTISDASTTQTSATNTLTTAYPKSSTKEEDDDENITSTIIQYVTLTSDSSTITSAVNTAVTTVANSNKDKDANAEGSSDTTTSTITSLVTVTDGNGSTQLSTQLSETTEAVAAETGESKQTVAAESALASGDNKEACVASTVTVTVTATPATTEAATTEGEEDDTTITVSTQVYVTSYPIQAEFTNSDTTTTITSFVEVTQTQLHTFTSSSSLYNNATTSSTGSIAPSYGSSAYANSTVPLTSAW